MVINIYVSITVTLAFLYFISKPIEFSKMLFREFLTTGLEDINILRLAVLSLLIGI